MAFSLLSPNRHEKPDVAGHFPISERCDDKLQVLQRVVVERSTDVGGSGLLSVRFLRTENHHRSSVSWF